MKTKSKKKYFKKMPDTKTQIFLQFSEYKLCSDCK